MKAIYLFTCSIGAAHPTLFKEYRARENQSLRIKFNIRCRALPFEVKHFSSNSHSSLCEEVRKIAGQNLQMVYVTTATSISHSYQLFAIFSAISEESLPGVESKCTKKERLYCPFIYLMEKKVNREDVRRGFAIFPPVSKLTY